jgi:predicted metalloendopeptidase
MRAQADMKAMVDAGQLTRTEVSMLREQAESKLAAVQSDLAAAQSTAGGAAPKKVAKLTRQQEQLTIRLEKLRTVEPIKHQLKHASAMKKLRKELAKLDASMDPGRPQKMEKIARELDEVRPLLECGGFD